MSVAKCLGIEHDNTTTMRRSRQRWPVWRTQERDLPPVAKLDDLRAWIDHAEPADRDLCLATLVRIGLRDQAATSAVTWLLLPGAIREASRLGDVSADIDAIFAGNLWIAARTCDWRRPRKVAATILATARRETMAELGIGQIAQRSDRTWSVTTPVDMVPDSVPAPTRNEALAAAAELREVLDDAHAAGVANDDELRLLAELGIAADALGAPAKRGRGGLTAPMVAEQVAKRCGASTRTVRRHAGMIIDRIAEHRWTSDSD